MNITHRKSPKPSPVSEQTLTCAPSRWASRSIAAHFEDPIVQPEGSHRITRKAEHLVSGGREDLSASTAPTPTSAFPSRHRTDWWHVLGARPGTPLAHTLDHAAETLGIDSLGGFSALVHKVLATPTADSSRPSPRRWLPRHVCSSVNVASTRAGINMGRRPAYGRNRARSRSSHHRHPVRWCR